MQIVATGFGDPDVLKAIPSQVRCPGRGEVTITVRAAAVNHRDLEMYASGDYTKGSGRDDLTFPLQLGIEAAGIVTEVEPDAVGDAGLLSLWEMK